MEYAYIVVFYKYSMYIVTKLYAVQYNFYKYKQVTFLTHKCEIGLLSNYIAAVAIKIYI